MSRGRRDPTPTPAWDLPAGTTLVSVCHPDWRGVRTAARGHGGPVVEVADAAAAAGAIVGSLTAAGVEVLVVQGFPPGADELIRRAAGGGVDTRLVLHSSMVQHGGDAVEAGVADLAVRLLHEGALGRLGFVKAGLAEAFAALGHPAWWVPNRVPTLPPVAPVDLGPGELHVGVFAEPFWRKNVVTQLGAVALLGGHAHLLVRPAVGYLDALPVTAHGLLPWERFVALQASVGLNLYVSLSECHPLSPVESYLAGVPCLTSRTSHLFRGDPVLRDLATVTEVDDPTAISRGARRLLDAGEEAVARARAWIARADADAAARWSAFIAR